MYFRISQLNTENKIGDEGAEQLAEALKSNITLATLDLSGNTLLIIVFFVFLNSIQVIILVMKEQRN